MSNRVSLMAAVPIALVLGLGVFSLTVQSGLPGVEVVTLSYDDHGDACSADELKKEKIKTLKKSDHDFLVVRISNKCEKPVLLMVNTTSHVECLGEPSSVLINANKEFSIPNGEKAYFLCRLQAGYEKEEVMVQQRQRGTIRGNEIGVDPPPGIMMRQEYVRPSTSPSASPAVTQ